MQNNKFTDDEIKSLLELIQLDLQYIEEMILKIKPIQFKFISMHLQLGQRLEFTNLHSNLNTIYDRLKKQIISTKHALEVYQKVEEPIIPIAKAFDFDFNRIINYESAVAQIHSSFKSYIEGISHVDILEGVDNDFDITKAIIEDIKPIKEFKFGKQLKMICDSRQNDMKNISLT
jgi:hypothetical protein